MPDPVARRPVEGRAFAELLASTAVEPAALIVEGEPGIGKTTFWLAAVEQARAEHFMVLSARPAAAESVMAYTSLADMLGDCDMSLLADLPTPQRVALDRVLLRGGEGEAATDQRAVGAAVLSVLTALADDSPILLAIDDLQWLDSSSRSIVAFVARRLPARVGVLGTLRTDPAFDHTASWLSMQNPDAVRRVRLGPLSLGALQTLLTERLGRSFPRPVMVRIGEVSGGNPFYALELARAVDDGRSGAEMPLSRTLSDLVGARIGGIGEGAHEALLATACDGALTVDLIAHATGSPPDRLADRLQDAEDKGIIAIEGDKLRFTHPLLATGVYANATAAQRRTMHRRLAAVVVEPERQARHLALAATTGDEEALSALDAAADSARTRGAPAAAAELLELALGLGGDTPERRIALASDHFNAGDLGRARVLLEESVAGLESGAVRARAKYALARLRLVVDSFFDAVDLFRSADDEAGDDYALKAQLLLGQSYALMNTRQLSPAIHAAQDSAANAERIGDSALLGQALAFLTGLKVIAGDGVDEISLRRALDLGDPATSTPVQFRPSGVHAMVLGWTGRLQESHQALQAVRKRCIDRGEESELIYVSFHGVLTAVWRGDFSEAALIADDSIERAAQLGGNLPMAIALSNRSIAAAFAGRTAEAEADALEGIALCERGGFLRMTEWLITILGFVALSNGDYDGALSTLQPLVTQFAASPRATEILIAASLPDAAESMIQLGRLSDAERLVSMLEDNGTRLDRAWMLAVGGRCRAMWHAAHGDLDAALAAAQSAMAQHDRVPMPFDRARTQMLVGQLMRRQRQKDASAAALGEALASFEQMGSSVWAHRARSELSRAKVVRGQSPGLTPSELRVAELAASGLRNRDIAAELFISPKTVEVNLSRIYRKLDIRSRAELGLNLSRRCAD